MARFGTGPADPGLFRWGPRPDFVGKPVKALAARPAPGVSVRLDEPHAFDRVDLRGEVPAVVTGSLDGAGADAVKVVAVAVNGRVAATTWTYVDHGRVRFVAMTGDRWLRQGRNSAAALPLP